MFRFVVWLRERTNRFWIAPALSVGVGVALCLLAWGADAVVPADAVPDVSAASLNDLLSIIATSMLAVATFSLGVLVSAFASVSSTATPRATELVMGDDGTRRAISAFVGSFVFAIVAKTGLSFDQFAAAGIFVLFCATLAVLAYLVLRLVLWIRTMSTLGRLGDTLGRIESVTRDELGQHLCDPWLGARRRPDHEPSGTPITPTSTGYLTHIDLARLQDVASGCDGVVHLTVRPGTFVDPTTPIAVIEHTDTVPDDVTTEVRAAVLIGQQRTFDQDPRYGFIVLGEVARRALSPAVNDPGTAIQVASLATAILVDELTSDRAPAARTADDVTVPDLDLGELVIDAFEAIGRDGAGDLAVSLRLQKLLGTLARNVPGPIADTAVAVAERAVQRSQHAMDLDHDRQVLQQTHTSLFSGAATDSPGSGRTPAS